MLGPLVILALLSICGGWIGIERFGQLSRSLDRRTRNRGGIGHSRAILTVAAVLVALLGWLIADRFYAAKPASAGATAASFPGPYKPASRTSTTSMNSTALSSSGRPCLLALRSRLGRRRRHPRRRCVAARRDPLLAEPFCSAGNPATCAPMRPGSHGAAAVILIYVLWIIRPSYLSSFIQPRNGALR